MTSARHSRPLKRIRDQNDKLEAAKGKPEIFENFRKANARKFRGFDAPESIIKTVEAAVNLDFEGGIAEERRLFGGLMSGTQSAAQRYVFFAERQVWKIPDVPDTTATLPVNKVGVIGAGTMGGGIAMNFANAGIPVTILETKQEALDKGLARSAATTKRRLKRASSRRSSWNGWGSSVMSQMVARRSAGRGDRCPTIVCFRIMRYR